ncbi:hypothetical protein [Desulfonatronum sp. SC1]|uniref:hypothetical protein n=1 Tax=Desulfonatronum sp. SC1 TaxID=2109626 RepID=UPI000D30EDF7|nr:hypothetical protein [Desulfonatronum sp. SC1]PTN36505.1 hypothetical protein C6366_09280 [Desulfonatronum sp. SC1]
MTIADTHVHIYPFYDLEAFLVHACRNLDRCSDPLRIGATSQSLPTRVLYLAESAGCYWFQETVHGRIAPPRGWTLRLGESARCVTFFHAEHGEVHIVPGRQMATAERLEVLGLGMEATVPDGLSLRETLTRIETARGTAVVPWAVGKWLFSRGRAIESLLHGSSPDSLLLGDSAMRPAPGPLPRLMRLAGKLGFGVAAGSDPLPLPGEERLVGTFAVFTKARFSPDSPAGLLRALFQDKPPHAGGQIVGHRRSYGSVLLKTIQLRFAKKTPHHKGHAQQDQSHSNHE